MANHMVVSELFAVRVYAEHSVCERVAAEHFVLELGVGQLVFQLGGVRSPDHL